MKLGRHSYTGIYRHLHAPVIETGNFCSISENVTFHGKSNHVLNRASTFPFHVFIQGAEGNAWGKGRILIGNDVWIGDSATILSGVTIGDGVVIAAKAVVTKDCEPYGVYAGNPARLKKYRFSKETIEKLLKIKWWDWSDEKIKENIKYFYSDINTFLKEFGEDANSNNGSRGSEKVE